MILAAATVFVAFIILLKLWVRLDALDEQVNAIQRRLRQVDDALSHPGPLNSQVATPAAASVAMPASAPSSHTQPPAMAPPPLPLPQTPSAQQPAAAPPAPSLATSASAPQRAAVPSAATPVARDLESEIGSRWVLVAGVLVLVLGVAFFVKYAFDRHWISETLRVAAGTLAGAAIWIGGVWLAGRGYQLYGRMVAGGGLAMLYLSAYAAGALYGLVPAGVALMWMAALSGITVVTADRQDSIGLATTAITLAFAAPALVATNQDHHIVLFVYDSMLVVATLLLVRRHDWLLLGLASFWLTWVSFAAWSGESYRASYFASTEIYLTIVCAMFLLILTEHRRSRHQLAKLICGVLSLGPLIYHFASVAVLFDHSLPLLVYLIVFTALGVALLRDQPWLRLLLWVVTAVPFLVWVESHDNGVWYVAAMAAAVGLYALHLAGQLRALDTNTDPAVPEMALFHLNGLGLFAWMYPSVYGHAGSTATLAIGLGIWNAVLAWGSRRRGAAGAVPHALALAFTFAAIAVALGLAGPWITVAWAAEGAAVIWVGLTLRRTPLRYGGTCLLALAIVRLAVWQFGETLVSFTLFLNARMATGAFIVVLLYGAAALHLRFRDSLGDKAREWTTGFVVAANVLTVALVTADIYSFWDVRGQQLTASFARELSISVTWAAYGMGLIALGFNRRSAVLRYLALGLLGITVTKLFVVDLLTIDGVYRIVGFIVLGLVLLAASFLYHRSRRRMPGMSAETVSHTAREKFHTG
jgi:uncharacterized membrane protein